MVKKKHDGDGGGESMSEAEFAKALEDLPYAEKMKLVAHLVSKAGEDRKSVRDPRAHRRVGTARDTAVQRAAAIKLYEMHVMQGMSFREIGEVLEISFERARQLFNRFYPNGEKGEADDGATERARESA